MFFKKRVFVHSLKKGIVRRFYNLGDRISAKKFKSSEGKSYTVVRYIAVEIDANPKTLKLVEDIAKANSESLLVYTHKLRDLDYYKTVTNSQQWKEFSKEDQKRETEEEILQKLEDSPSLRKSMVEAGKTKRLKNDNTFDEINKLMKL